MIRIVPILMRERLRRMKEFLQKKPIFAVSFVISVISIVYMIADGLEKSFHFSDILNNQIVVLVIMTYLVVKIINPTQGMTLDYQLLQLKLISYREYKFLISLKLLGGSIILSLLCLNFYTEMVAIVCALNATVNVWVFLRNRWDSRVYDFFVAITVIVGMKYQLLYFSLFSMVLMVAIFVAIRRVNYESILFLYKFTYQVGQQRFNGVTYSEKETQDIQVSAEKLVGKAKEKISDWCEKSYDKDRNFIFNKELARLMANSGKFIAYFIISILIGMSGCYLPKDYIIVAFALLVVIALNFDMLMNRTEANLLMRGYVRHYIVFDIIKNKLFIYTIVNLILMLPSAFLGWKIFALAIISSFLIALIALYKCFKIK